MGIYSTKNDEHIILLGVFNLSYTDIMYIYN